MNWKRTRRLLPGALIPIVMATLLGAPGPAGASAPGPNTYSFFVRYKGTLVEHRETPGATLRDGSPGPPDLADLDFRFDLDVFYRKVNINEPATTFPTKIAADAYGTWQFATNSNASLKTTCQISATEPPQNVLPFPFNPQFPQSLHFPTFIPLSYATVGAYVSGGDPTICSPKRPRGVDLGVAIPNDVLSREAAVIAFTNWGVQWISTIDDRVQRSGSSGADTWSVDAVVSSAGDRNLTEEVADPFNDRDSFFNNLAGSSQGTGSDPGGASGPVTPVIPVAPVTSVTSVTSKASASVKKTVKKTKKKKTGSSH